MNLRLKKAKELLVTTNMSIKQIAFEMGFQSNYYFTRIFTKKMGVTPTGIRKGLSE
jgi:transcriptional regulator GlxA family with amidase domain